jgi:hypothetical protein
MKFFQFEIRWFGDILRAMLPPGGEDSLVTAPPHSAIIRSFVRDFGDRSPFDTAIGLRLAIWVVTLAPLFWRLKLKTFGKLDEHEQLELLHSMGGSNIYFIREIPTLLKMMGSFALFSPPATHQQLGSSSHDGTMPKWYSPDAEDDAATLGGRQ